MALHSWLIILFVYGSTWEYRIPRKRHKEDYLRWKRYKEFCKCIQTKLQKWIHDFFCLGEIIHSSTLATVPRHTYALHHCNQNTIQLRILNFGRKIYVCKTAAMVVVVEVVQLNTFAMHKWGQFEIYIRS